MKKWLTGIISLTVILAFLGSAFFADTNTTLADTDTVTIAIANADSIDVTWPKADGIGGYFVMRSTNANDGYQAIDMIFDTNQTTITDKTANPGITYYYKIQAFKNGDVYDITTPVSAQIEKKDIDISTSAIAVSLDGSNVKVEWNKVDGATNYFIMRSANEDYGYQAVDIIFGGNESVFTDKKVSAGNTYYYKIQTFINGQICDITAPEAIIVE